MDKVVGLVKTMKNIIGKFINYQTDPSFYDLQRISVEVSEEDNLRSMHIGNDTVQSKMSLKDPYQLQLNYTKVISLVLIFTPDPENIIFLGLGGASLQKFFFKNCKKSKLKTIEINKQVINVAKSFFNIPKSNRFEIIHGDGVEYLNDSKEIYDLIISDAFDDQGIPDIFCDEYYYNLCHARLSKKGIFIINFWGSDPKSKNYIKKIRKVFNNQVLFAAADRPGNIIVFAFKSLPKELRLNYLKKEVKRFEKISDISLMVFFNRLLESAESTTGHRLNF